MLTCVSGSKQADEQDGSKRYAGKQHSTKTLTSQIKEMALKASGSYRSCTPAACGGQPQPQQQLQSNYSGSGRVWGKEMEARLKGISMGSGDHEAALSSAYSSSGRRYEPIVLIQEIEPKEWVAQVEPGVLITFISLPPPGGNHLKRIRFSREMFNKWQAQRWWQENFDKLMELYNVRRLNLQAFPLPKSEDEPHPHPHLNSRNSNIESIEGSTLVPTLGKERVPHPIDLDHQGSTLNNESIGLAVSPKASSISATKNETSSLDASNSSRELSISKVSDVDNEWVEQVEPGVYITIRVLPGGSRELRRVRFSREKFGEVHARLWWEENRARIQKQYL